MSGHNLQKYLKKTGRTFEEDKSSPDVLEHAGQRRMKDKIKMADKSGDELPAKPGDIARAVAGKSGRTGSLTKVKSDKSTGVEKPIAEFRSAGQKKKYS